MSSNVPIPPPPLAPPFLFQGGVGGMACELSNQKIILENDLHYVPNAEQELISNRNRLWAREGWTDSPILTVYQYIPPILQIGPQ